MPHPGTEGEKQRCSLIKCLVVAQGDTQVGIYQQGATLSVDVTTGPRVGGSKAKNPLVYIQPHYDTSLVTHQFIMIINSSFF